MTERQLAQIADDYIARFRPSEEGELRYFRTLRTDGWRLRRRRRLGGRQAADFRRAM